MLCCASWACRSRREGAPGEAADAAEEAEEERRKEEARARAEAEQAALEAAQGGEPGGVREARAQATRRGRSRATTEEAQE